MVKCLSDKSLPGCIWSSEEQVPVLNDFSNQTVNYPHNGYCSLTQINSLLSNNGYNPIGYYISNQSSATGYYISFPISFTERYSYINNETMALVNDCPSSSSQLKISLSQSNAYNLVSDISLPGPGSVHYVMGLNATGTNNVNSNNITNIFHMLASTAGLVLSIYAPEVAAGIAISGIVLDGVQLIAATGQAKDVNSVTGNNTAYETASLIGGATGHYINSGKCWYFYNNTFSYGSVIQNIIYPCYLSQPVKFNVSADECGLALNYDSASYNYCAAPANQIAGKVLLNNNLTTPDANQWVSICHVLGERSTSSGETLCTETYHVKTNSHGEYRFFANCNTGYGISANISTPFGDSSHFNSITTGAAGGTTFDNFSLYLSNVNGKVTNSNNGKPISGADVTFTSSEGTSYTVSTNDTGGYSLDIANNGTYNIKVTATGYLGSSGSVSLSDNTKTQNFPLTPAGTVNFDESGLHGNTWSVTLDGQSVQSTSSQISFEVAYGSYSYSIGSVSGYSSSPSSGSVTSGSSPVTQDISFSPTSYYGVTFDESGLPSGHTWSVTMGGTTNSASTGSSIGFSEPNGYFSYSPSRLLVAVPGEPGYYYDYYASGGTAHVNGAAQTIDISYSHIIVHYCVNATAEILLANNTYDRAANITDGMFLMTYNITTGTLQKGEVTSVLSVNEPSLYTINGNLVVSGDQPILTSNGWINASSLHKGELVFDPITGSFVDIYSLHHSQETETMYDFIISGNDNYIAYTYLLQGV